MVSSTAPSINNRPFQFLAALPLRFPWLILLLCIILSGASLTYTVRNLGINTNTSELLAPDLPFVQVRLKLEHAFPQDAAAILVVVESATPEQTAMAAEAVTKRLQSQSALFQSAYIPDDNPFFRRQGFLYLELDALEKLSAKLIDAQPFIGYLSKNYHMAGLTDILSLALEDKQQEPSLPLDPLLGAIDRALVAVKAGQPHYVSWQQLLTEENFGRDQTRRLIIAKPHMDFDELLPAGKPMDYLRDLAAEMAHEHPGISLSFTGEVALEHEEMESVNQDMIVSGIASTLLVCIVLWLGLRSFRLLFATFVALIGGLVLTAGFATLTVGHLNLISISFAVLYIGLGVDFATHLCLHYQECRRQGLAADEAIGESMHTVAPSLFLCALTTAIGFFAFIPTDFKGVSELGVIAGGGMFIGLAVSLSLLPAMLKVMPIKASPAKNGASLPGWVYGFPFRHARAIRLGALVVAILAGFTLTQVTFDTNPINLRDPNTQSVVAFKKLLQSKTDSPFAVSALTDNLAQADRLAADFTRLPSVHEAVTLSNLVPEQQDEKLEIIDNLNLIMPGQLDRFERAPEPSDVRAALVKLDSALQLAAEQSPPRVSPELLARMHQDVQDFIRHADSRDKPAAAYAALEHSLFKLLPRTMLMLRDGLTASGISLDDLPDDVRSQWVSDSGLYRVLVMPEQDLNNPRHLKTFVNETMATHPSIFGLPVGDVTSGQAIVDAFIQAFASALALIILLLLAMTRSLKSTLLIITPLLLAALLTAASNVLLDNPFNFANIIVLPLLLGMGVDSGIHMVHRLRHPQSDAADLLQSSSARGVFFSALTTLCSFSSLAFNSHRGTASMGLLLSIGIALTLICSLLVLPALSYRKQARESGSG
jgi:hopanoid biosynthesis associated RND transporter like protein HpnN